MQERKSILATAYFLSFGILPELKDKQDTFKMKSKRWKLGFTAVKNEGRKGTAVTFLC